MLLQRSLARLAASRAASSTAASTPGAPLTKIVATIGPASEQAEPLADCVAAGAATKPSRCMFFVRRVVRASS